MASDTVTVSATTWPKTAANRQLVVNDDLQAPIYYIGPTQVNFQVPSNAPLGAVRLAVRTADTGELVAGGSFLVSSVGPGIFTANAQGTGQAAVLNQDFTINSTSNPAPAGSIVSIYATGQGQVSPAVIDGTAAGSSPLSNTIAVPTTSGTTCLNSQPSMCVAVGSRFRGCKVFGTGARLHRTVADQCIDSTGGDGRGTDPSGNQRDTEQYSDDSGALRQNSRVTANSRPCPQ